MSLPIDIVPCTRPPRFKWRTIVETPGGPRVVDHHGTLPSTIEGPIVELLNIAKQYGNENREMRLRIAELEIDLEKALEAVGKLQAFKDWVHDYLDKVGVPKEFPDGEHTKEGCRVGDRLDYLVSTLAPNRKGKR